MAEKEITILDLPQDVLEIIFVYLHPRSFLNFCSITNQFWQSQRRNPTYWRVTTSSTFRIPISPLLHARGDRWYWLYKKLRIQTKAFAWGQGAYGELGLPAVPGPQGPDSAASTSRRLNYAPVRVTDQPQQQPDGHAGTQRPVPVFNRRNQSWPSRMDVQEEIGIVADLQCGGWSTTLLSSEGDLYSVGTIDGDYSDRNRRGSRYRTPCRHQLTRLDYRSQVPIRKFSCGRKHVLGLDEEGHVWSWNRIDVPAWQIHDVVPIKASVVVGGWSVSSAYTTDGIVYWRAPAGIITVDGTDETRTPLGSDSLDGTHAEGGSGDGAKEFVKLTVIPGTSYRSKQKQSGADHNIGEVLTYVVLEAYLVFITDLAKVFACRIVGEYDPGEMVFEVPSFSARGRELKDVQGSFRKFSVFTAAGEVLSGDQQYLDRLYDLRKAAASENDSYSIALEQEAREIERPADIAALQHTGVISIAYGDYHFHALHSDGQITAYGREPQLCGALGLGGIDAGAKFRGVKLGNDNVFTRDGRLMPIAYKNGREVWFSKSQKVWLRGLEDWMRTARATSQDHPAFAIISEQEDKRAAYSEWVEREGKAWEEGVESEDGLRSHFAISVAAAGWHSAALVLENSDLVEHVEEKWSDKEGNYIWEKDGFPRIRLPDGFEFPGSGALREWKGGMPTVDDLDTTTEQAYANTL